MRDTAKPCDVEETKTEPAAPRKEINGSSAHGSAERFETRPSPLEGASVGMPDNRRRPRRRSALGQPMEQSEVMDLTGIDIGYTTKSARFLVTNDAPSPTTTEKADDVVVSVSSAACGFYADDEQRNTLVDAGGTGENRG